MRWHLVDGAWSILWRQVNRTLSLSLAWPLIDHRNRYSILLVSVLFTVVVFDVSSDTSIYDFLGLLGCHYDLLLFNILFQQVVIVVFQLIVLVLLRSHDLLVILLLNSLTANWLLLLFVGLSIAFLAISHSWKTSLVSMMMALCRRAI